MICFDEFMLTDCIDGYGFRICASDEQLMQFILKHKAVIPYMAKGSLLLDYAESCTGETFHPKEEFPEWEDDITGDEGIYAVVAGVMRSETGLTFEFRKSQDENEDDAIIFPEMYPWQMNEKEKSLTRDELEAICKKYIDDLGGSLTAMYIRLEYYG